jgi:hypothetical protein
MLAQKAAVDPSRRLRSLPLWIAIAAPSSVEPQGPPAGLSRVPDRDDPLSLNNIPVLFTCRKNPQHCEN